MDDDALHLGPRLSLPFWDIADFDGPTKNRPQSLIKSERVQKVAANWIFLPFAGFHTHTHTHTRGGLDKKVRTCLQKLITHNCHFVRWTGLDGIVINVVSTGSGAP